MNDGAVHTAQVDLPVASFCAPEVRTELREKFMRETTPALGLRRAADAFMAGLKLGEVELADFVRLVTK